MEKKHFFLIFLLLLFFPSLSFAKEADFSFPKKNNLKSLILSVEDIKENVPLEKFSQWELFFPYLIIDPSGKSEIENINFCPEKKIICRLTFSLKDSVRIKKLSKNIFDNNKIKLFVSDLAKKIDKDPINAIFVFEEEKVSSFSPSSDGIKLDINKSTDKIINGLTSNIGKQLEITLIFQKIPPEVTEKTINDFGITTLIGEGRSNFRGSPANRIKNIRVGSQRFNGILIKPAEEFSFVKVLGPVDEEHGYLPELVIKRDKTEPEFGGGICQVSTTAFRAAIYSGLKITARRNHAYPVQYYNPQGLDATVYIPKPDLKFINNTPSHILIQTKIERTELVFQFYGTSDGRKTEIDGPYITERNPDGSLKAYFVQKVIASDGNVLLEDTFKSAYDSPSKYPHPGQEKFTKKPKDWSKREWETYKKANGI